MPYRRASASIGGSLSGEVDEADDWLRRAYAISPGALFAVVLGHDGYYYECW